jgi:hypothetical protein
VCLSLDFREIRRKEDDNPINVQTFILRSGLLTLHLSCDKVGNLFYFHCTVPVDIFLAEGSRDKFVSFSVSFPFFPPQLPFLNPR